uniref:Aquaporin-9 n=1 Tax=Syphacia muris TaxID=451379 RepID=A0A0N5AHI6_9BILA
MEKVNNEHYIDRWRRKYQIKNVLARNLLAEFFATAILRFIGTGVLAQAILGRGQYTSVQVNLGWGFAIALSVYSAWKTSGGHVNPAVTAVLYILGKISFTHSVCYCIAQTLGAAFGAALSYEVYIEAINDFDGGVRSAFGTNSSTGAIFASFPAPYLSNTGAFIDQVAGTGLLGLFVAFFCERRNQIPLFYQPSLFGVIAAMVGVCYSMNMGSPINPASDLGPRIFAALYGYGWEMITYQNYFFWVPVVAPMVGAVLGAYMYVLFIGLHIPDQETKYSLSSDEELKPLKF